MTDQGTPPNGTTTPPPDNIPDDTPDTQLTAAQRRQIVDTAQRMIASGNASITDAEAAGIPRSIMRRAWNRYQKNFEASEKEREAFTVQQVQEQNHDAMENL